MHTSYNSSFLFLKTAHEAPQAVNTLMREWVKVVEDTRKAGKHPTALEEALARQAEEVSRFHIYMYIYIQTWYI